MGDSQAQPLEVTDFAGGITENILDADPRRYQFADNFLITNDKKLRVRPAFAPLANGAAAALPWGNQRTTSMFSWLNESLLVAQSEKNFAWYDPKVPQWNQILGLGGNPVLSGASIYAQTTFAEFQKQAIVTSDGGTDPYGSLPVMFYQDSTNTWVARTAGLPRAFSQGNYTYSTLLNQCITVANAIRASMILHLQDAVRPVYGPNVVLSQVSYSGFDSTNLHNNIDNIALSYFQAVTFSTANNEPNNLANPPTPAPAAFDQASLYALVGAMNTAYGKHIADAMIGSYNENPLATGTKKIQANAFSNSYHFPMQYVANLPPVKGPLAQLSNASLPLFPSDATKQLASLTTVAAQLDDLNQKWYWHQFAINTHDKFNRYDHLNKYTADQPTIGTVLAGNGAAVITPDYTDFINYVNNLATIYSGHIGVNGPHTQQANALVSYAGSGDFCVLDTNIYLPPATDLNSAYLLLYWLRAQYFVHFVDASVTDFSTFTCSITSAGSPTIPTPVFPTTGIVATPGQWVFNNRIDTGGPFALTLNSNINTDTYGLETLCAQVVTVSTNWTVDRKFINAYVKNFQISSSKYHSYNVSGALGSATTAQTAVTEMLASGPTALGSSLTTWMSLGAEFFNALGSHAFNAGIHASNADIATTLPPIPIYVVNLTTRWTKNSINACSTPFFIPVIANYSYAFVYSYKYTVQSGGIQYLIKSNPVYSISIAAPTSLPVGATIATTNANFYPSVSNTVTRGIAISVLPSLVNTSETNYDVANVSLEIYRTTSGATTYYLNNSVASGSITNYTDTANDAVQIGTFGPQITQAPLYTNGGVVGSDAPPKSKFVHLLNGTAYYAGVYDSGQFFPQRIRQAVALAPEWSPANFTDDLDDEITGLTSAKDNLIAGCKNSIYRVSGGFTQSGQGLFTHERISDSIGMLNAKSIVKTEIGVFFAGNDGFYYTDGYQIIKISLEFDKVYQTFVQSDGQRRAIYGGYDKTTRRVWWSLRTSPNETDNSTFYIFYLNYGVKPSGVFTTASNYPYVRPSSFVFQQGVLYYGHELGFVLFMDQGQKQDYVPSTSVAPANWLRVGIPYNYTSCAIDTGTAFKRKWFTKFHFIGGNQGNAAINIAVIRDMNSDGRGITNMKAVNYTDNVVWGTPTCVWGDATQIWNNTGKMDLWRRFPTTSLRGDYVQIQITPAKVAVYSSSIGYPFGATVVVNSGTKTATLQTPAGYSSLVFFPDVVTYSIAFQNDGYIQEYPIASLDATSKIITYSDTANLSASGTVGWVIRGIKKEQRFELSSYIIHYMLLGDKVQRYPGNTSDAGSGNGGENPT